ncbi:MAG: ATP-binding protein, partial [Acidobacteriota bacterium]
DDALVLEPRQSSVAFEFAALDFTNSARTRYAYQLQGFDDGWIDNGAQRMARYHRLPPGRYRFRVMALGSDGLGKEGDSLAIRILPPFWQTWWFRLAGLLVALAGLMAAHRLRVARLLELERLRTRIAGDLHDDLSSELSGIALAMEVLQHQRPEEQRPRLEQVRQRSLLMLERLRDIVWCVNPEHDNQEALVRRLRQVAETLLVDRPYRFETRLVGSGEIPLALRRHLLLVFKEALHNAVRHADAQRIDIRLTSNAGKLCLSVVDDGIGFDIDTATGGYGLASLRRRAAEMGATFRLTSRPGAGTALRLEAPLQRWRRR